jgi:hypothetical protein
MNRLAQLLGSSTRANVVLTLALARRPLSAYRVSKICNMNIAKVYIDMKKLANLSLVSKNRGRRGLEYTLVDDNLRSLALKLSPRMLSYDDWRSAEARAERFRSGFAKVPDFSLGGQTEPPLVAKLTRMLGELESLAQLARSKFDKRYRRIGDHEYARL